MKLGYAIALLILLLALWVLVGMRSPHAGEDDHDFENITLNSGTSSVVSYGCPPLSSPLPESSRA